MINNDDNSNKNSVEADKRAEKSEKQEVEAEPACIGGKTGSYSVWQPTDTRALVLTTGAGSAGGGWVGNLRSGGGDLAGGVGGSSGSAVTAMGGATSLTSNGCEAVGGAGGGRGGGAGTASSVGGLGEGGGVVAAGGHFP